MGGSYNKTTELKQVLIYLKTILFLRLLQPPIDCFMCTIYFKWRVLLMAWKINLIYLPTFIVASKLDFLTRILIYIYRSYILSLTKLDSPSIIDKAV